MLNHVCVVPFLRILLYTLLTPKIINTKLYPPKKATNIKLCSKIRKQTADNESPVSQKHPKRTTVMRREGKRHWERQEEQVMKEREEEKSSLLRPKMLET